MKPTERTVDRYSGSYFSQYADDRSERIVDGWVLIDENLITKCKTSGNYVTGCVVYEKSSKK